MMVWELPTTLEVGGIERNIRTDYRDILRILCAYEDPDLEKKEKVLVCLTVLYEDVKEIPPELYGEAIEKAKEFIDHGASKKEGTTRTMDWEQDAPLIIPAINKVAGREVRAERLHWWTFLGYYMEIGESQFSTVVGIRQKLQKRKPLDKHEKEFYQQNKPVVDLKKKISEEELDALDELIGWRDDK